MSNYIEVKTELINYLKARTPFVVIESSERNRVERMLEEIALEEKFDIDYYVDSKQVVKLGKQAVVIDASGNPLTYALGCIKKHNTANFVIGDARHLNSDNSFSRELLDLLYMGIERKATIIVITPDEVWPKLTVLGLITTLDYPNLEERCLQISQFIERYKGVFKIDWTNEDIYKVATLLRGLSEVQLDNILCAEIITLNHLKKENIGEIVAEKNKLFGHFSNVNQISLSKKTNVIGHDNLKEWLVEKKQMFYMPESVLEEYSLSRPKGVLLVGVPGCGKSYSAKMIAEKWDLPLFKFDLDTIYDKWVGESERKMRDALTYVDNIAPCVLWVDEIEKSLATSDSGNETSKRILSQFLFWLQESQTQVFLVATANNVQQLPAELFRKGRFSEIFFIDLPNKNERKSCIEHYIKTSIKQQFFDGEIDQMVSCSEGYSYADIEMAIKEVAQDIVIKKTYEVSVNYILEKFKSIIPISKSNPEFIAECRNWGKERAVVASKVEVGNEC